mmetsp:Transcript_1594/g.2383  ORF Transcript_1594/g.2383 Transcript_1594/m.2383 type:complete len:699 (+) Transcript_1594:50-2146(+)
MGKKGKTSIGHQIQGLLGKYPKLQISLALALVGGGGGSILYKYYQHKQHLEKNREFYEKLLGRKEGDDDDKKKKIGINKKFIERLMKILPIMIPNIYSKEALYIAIITVLMFVRTYFNVKIQHRNATVAQSLVSKDYHDVLMGILQFAALSIPSACVTQGLKYATAMMNLRFRMNVSHHIHQKYLEGTNFYKSSQLGTHKISNISQRVTKDVEEFSFHISKLFVTIVKPILDVTLYTYKLSEQTGWQGPIVMYAYYAFSVILKRIVMPSFGRLAAIESELEGSYRSSHQRLITNAEEVAFYDGAKTEKKIINERLITLSKHKAFSHYMRGIMDIMDNLVVKYWATLSWYGVNLVPMWFNINNYSNKSTDELTRDYILNASYGGNLSNGIGKVIKITNTLSSIAGYTHRLSELLEMIDKLDASGVEPFEEVPSQSNSVIERSSPEALNNWLAEWKNRCKNRNLRFNNDPPAPVVGGGKMEVSDHIEFDGVDIVSPEGKVLVKNLNMIIERDQNVMVTGPNGCGKSSLFRVIGELWPLHCGVLKKPHKEEVVFVPQKPYLVIGTFRDQIIYPHSKSHMQKIGVTDDDLRHLLEIVDPTQTMLNEWEFDSVADWFNALSGGQKQRMAMARLFYHCPKYAILDECTSSVSGDVENELYTTCKKLEIAIFSVSHRPDLIKHHTHHLAISGRAGTWSLSEYKQQ